MRYFGSVIAAAVVASIAFAAPLGAAPVAPQLSVAPDGLVVAAAVKKKVVYKKKKVVVKKKVVAKKPVVVIAIGPQCVANVTREGSQNVIRRLAEASARNAWQRAVRSQYGERYLNLGIARNGNLTCVPSAAGGLFKRCTLSADPCKAAGT